MSSSRFDLTVKKDFGIQLTEAQLRLQRDKYNHHHNVPETEGINTPIIGDIELTESQSTVSTAAKSGEDENSAKMLRKVLNSTNKIKSTSVASNIDQKARLRKILEKRSNRSRNSPSLKQESKVPAVQTASTPYAATAAQLSPSQNPVSNSYGAARQLPVQRLKQQQPTTGPAPKSDTSGSTKNSKEDQKALLRKVLAKSRAKRQHAIDKRISPRSSLLHAQKRNLLDDEPKPLTVKMQEATRECSKASRDSLCFDQAQPMLARAAAVSKRLSPRSTLLMSQKSKSMSGHAHREPLAAVFKKQEPKRDINAPVPRLDCSLLDRKPPPPPPPHLPSPTFDTSRARKSDAVGHAVPSKAASRLVFGRRSLAQPSSSSASSQRAATTPIQRTSAFNRISPTKLKLPPPEKDLDSYSAFFSVLQKEGAGDHRELWRSFRSVFQAGEKPLTEKKKRVKFDSKTKKELTEMNLHLKRSSKIECKAETQLVNDKKFIKLGGRMLQTRQPSKLDRESLQQFEVGASGSHESETRSETSSLHEVLQPCTVEAQRVELRDVEVPPTKSGSDKQGWLVSFNAKQKKKNPMLSRVEEDVHDTTQTEKQDIELGPPSRQASWLTAHRQKQERKRSDSLQTEAAFDESSSPTRTNRTGEDELSPSSLSGRKRAIDDHPVAVPWARVQLKSTRATMSPNREQHVTPAFKNVQLRETHILSPDEVPDENDVSAEEDKSEHLAIAPLSDENGLRVTATTPAAPRFQSKTTTSKKYTVVQSFVPAATDGTASSTQVKLKHSRGYGTTFELPEPQSPAAPWLNVKLRKSSDIKPEIEDEPTDFSYRQVLHKTKFAYDDHNHSQDEATANPVEFEEIEQDTGNISKADTRNALSNMFAARQAPLVDKQNEESTEKAEKRSPLEKSPQAEITNDLSSMFAARLGPPAPAETVTPAEKLSPSEIKTALSNMFAARLGPPIVKNKGDEIEEAIAVGDEIDLDHLSVRLQQLLEHFVEVELWGIPGIPCEVVVLGKELIVISALDSTAMKRRVTWCLKRASIESITLDMARNIADLMLSDATQKSLRFKNVEGCLRFASCFYQAPIAIPTEAVTQVGRSHVEQAVAISAPKEGNCSSPQEHLNQEEQQLLMRYREARKVKGPDDAMKETIGNEVSGVEPALSDEEQKIVERYKKMLKMKIPAEAVQHKMAGDGVDPKIIGAVMSKDTGAASETKTLLSSEGNGLTAEEQMVADKFLKMLKMRIPPEAVQHKMVKEGTNQKIIDVVLKNGKSRQEQHTQPKNKLSDEEEKCVSSFRKMLKMCIPPDAVRHRMKKEQVSSKLIFAVFPEDAKAGEGEAPVNKASLSENEQKIAATYQKMLKMRIPPEAVRHKMAKEGIDHKIVMIVLGEEPKAAKSSNGLSSEEEKAVESFKKMVKMNLPEAAIRHKMKKEGTSEKVILAVFGDGNSDSKMKGATQRKNSALRGSKLVALHWTPISGEELDNSVWRASKKRKVTTAKPETNDISKLVELFKKKSNPKGGASSTIATNSNSTGKAKLVDLNRANNIAISLKAFRDFTHKELAETVAHMDPQNLITGERIQFMKDILPTTREVQAVQAFKGDDSRLVAAEHFFKHVASVKRIEVKVEIMQTIVSFRANSSLLVDSFQVLERACFQVQTSEKLTDVLDMVLHVGNIMNEGTRTGGAAGFKFDSLLKLTQTKSSDGKTTVLDYLVMIFVAKNKRETLDIKTDFQDCQAGSRMLVSDMNGEVKSMSDALKKCKTELANLRKETGKTREDKPEPIGATSAYSRAGLFADIKSLGAQGENSAAAEKVTHSNGGPVNSYLEAIKAKQEEEQRAEQEVKKPGKLIIKDQGALKAENEGGSALLKAITSCTNPALDDESDAPLEGETEVETKLPSVSSKESKREATIDGGIEKLEDFITEADETLTKLKGKKDASINACRALSKYCGEGGGEKVATTLLGILFQFATNLSDAVKKYDKRLELEAKREEQNKKMEQQKRRKNFVESKGFGNSIATIAETESAPKPAQTEKLSDSPPALDVGPVGSTMEDSTKVSTFDPSQLQGDAKAKVVPKSKDGSSLVLMVNQLLKAASPQAKMDYETGVVHDDVEDETLKAIYEKERLSLSTAFRSPPRRKTFSSNLDILSAIKQRREFGEEDSATCTVLSENKCFREFKTRSETPRPLYR